MVKKTTTGALRFTITVLFLLINNHHVECFNSNTSNNNIIASLSLPRKNILSEDPKLYTVDNFLSSQECATLIDLARNSSPDEFTRSNAPAAGVSIERLWPLGFVPFLASAPSAMKSLDDDGLLRATGASSSSLLLDAVTLPFVLSLVSICVLVGIANIAAKKYASNSRTSCSLALNKEEHFDLIKPIMERAYVLTSHPWTKFEAPVITRYRVGEAFGVHNDASPTQGSEWVDEGGQRVVTLIIYLNTLCNAAGGQTRFNILNCDISPQEGKACIFYSTIENTLNMDNRMIHESIAVQQGEKWVMQLFGRVNRVPSPLGISNNFNQTYEFKNTPQ